ncbi:MAG: thermonuclease family protein [Blastocatellia bacterium]|nr:thermonuclease family protein [Blastocatellia bacterium]
MLRKITRFLITFLLIFSTTFTTFEINLFAQETSKKTIQQGFQAEVIKVVDGDTIKIRRNGAHKQETIRLIGIEAPEVSSREQTGQEPFGVMAQQHLSVAITRRIIRIEQDVQKEAETGEILGYVWLDDKLMNEEMLKSGLAVLATTPPNVKYVERFQTAQTTAREQKKAIWNPDAPLTQSPSEFRSNKREATAAQSEKESELEIPDYIAGCIVGNRKTKKFHVPEGRYYNQAKDSKNRVFFKTAADAEKSGYTKSAR